MRASSRLVFLLVLLAGMYALSAADPPTVGIVPFDVTTVEGSGGPEAGRVLGTVVRVEMLKDKGVRPQLIALPNGTRPPLTPKQAAELGKSAEVDFVLLGTVLEASTTRNTNRANTTRLGGLVGNAVGGSLTRTSAKVMLHAELVDAASGASVGNFEVEGANTDTGVGADLFTTLGSFNVGDDGWQKTPMGKALREAAQKLTIEVGKRANR